MTTQLNYDKERVAIVIPARNEADGIGKLVKEAKDFAGEVIVVDGHSDDNTLEVAIENGAQVVRDHGLGKGDAYKVGANLATSEILVFLDGDGSHNIKDVPFLLSPILEGRADLVIGSRMTGGSDEFHGSLSNYLRMVGGGFITLLINLKWKTNLTDCLNGFRALRRETFLDLGLKTNDFDIEQAMVTKYLQRGYRVTEVPSHEYERRWGVSKLPTFRKAHRFLWQLLIDMLSPPGNTLPGSRKSAL